MKDALVGAGYSSRVVFLEADLVRNVRAALQMLWGGVCFVLLIAAVNVTNLSLVRANARRRELATRSALGAGRARLIRQLVTETLLLTALGGALGLLLGAWSLNALTWLGLSDLPRAHEIRLDGTVLALTAGLAAILGIVVGAVPALQAGRSGLAAALNEEGRGSTAGRGARAAQGGLVVSQVALAFLLLAGAGLLLESFRRLLGADPGFVAQHVLTGRVSPLPVHYPDDTALRDLRGPGPRARSRPARRRGRGHQQLPALQLGRQQQRDHPRGLHRGSWRLAGLAQPALRHPGLPRGDAGVLEARPHLHRGRRRPCSARGHRGRAAGGEVLAERRSRGPPRVLPQGSRRRRASGPRRLLVPGGRGRGQRQAARPRGGRERPGRRVSTSRTPRFRPAASASPSGRARTPPA